MSKESIVIIAVQKSYKYHCMFFCGVIRLALFLFPKSLVPSRQLSCETGYDQFSSRSNIKLLKTYPQRFLPPAKGNVLVLPVCVFVCLCATF